MIFKVVLIFPKTGPIDPRIFQRWGQLVPYLDFHLFKNIVVSQIFIPRVSYIILLIFMAHNLYINVKKHYISGLHRWQAPSVCTQFPVWEIGTRRVFLGGVGFTAIAKRWEFNSEDMSYLSVYILYMVFWLTMKIFMKSFHWVRQWP